MEQYFEDKKIEVLLQIENYLQHKYPNITVIYKEGSFIISGDEVEADKCKKEIEEMFKFSAKN